MQSFELHFGSNGEVIVNNIKGLPTGSDECLNLTSPYEKSLGVPIARTMLDQTPIDYVNINIKSGENA